MLTANEILEWDDAGTPAVVRPLLDVEALSKTYNVKPAGWRTQVWRPWQRHSASQLTAPVTGARSRRTVEHVSFTVLPGVSMAIVGEAGAGKSTLGRLIMGQLAPDNGSATRSCQVQMLPQDVAAFFPANQTIPRVVAAAFAPQQLAPEAARLAADALLERVGLTPSLFRHETMARLTTGQRQRIGIALALVGEPQLIILDEPTAGLGAVAAAPLIELLHDLRLERGLTYLVLTRDIEIARALSDSIQTLTDGRLSNARDKGAP